MAMETLWLISYKMRYPISENVVGLVPVHYHQKNISLLVHSFDRAKMSDF